MNSRLIVTARKLLPCLLLFLFASSSSCRKNDTIGPDEQSLRLEEAFSIAAQNSNLRCLIVYKDAHIVKERYFHPGDSASAQSVRSVTKSVMSILVGIAIDEGTIPSEDSTIGGYVRTLVDTLDAMRGSITVRHLLSMSSGLSGNDIPDILEYNNWFDAPDQLKYTLGKPLVNQPGQAFGYNSGASHIISVILTRAAGTSTYQFARSHLFEPLGIADPSWGTDKQGNYNGASALSLTPHDLLKIGRLCLNKGVYNGVRVVSEEWIDKATTFKITTNGVLAFGPGYGYLWWIGNTSHHPYYFANGFGGQFIVIVPDLQMIVVATNNCANIPIDTANQQWYSTMDVIVNRIIPIYQ